jgi:DNA primase
VRAVVTIAMVLQLLGCTLRGTGAQQRGPCPLHGSTSGTSRCFSANLDESLFRCFKCGHQGNAVDLWATATKQSPYDAAIDLCARLSIPLPLLATPRPPGTEEEPVAAVPGSPTMSPAGPNVGSSL